MKINLGTLKDKGDELVSFLEPRVGVKPSLSGDSVEIDDEGVRKGVRPRDVKTYIKRFLFMKGVRKNYRVFVSGKELTVQEIELGEEEEAKAEEKPKEEPKAEEKPKEAEPEPAKEQAAPEKKKEEPKPSKPKKASAKKQREKKKEQEG
jgi:sRNA-binding protein